MNEIVQTQETVEPAEKTAEEKPPWYTLNPARLSRSRLVRAVLIGLVIVSISVIPLWRLFWFLPVYALQDFLPVRDSAGRYRAAWRWALGKEIRIYCMPGVEERNGQTIAAGVNAMVEDIGLDMTVRVLPPPATIFKAYRDSTIQKSVLGENRTCIRFNQLQSRLITLRDGDPHADLLIVDAPLAECWWAHGIATFTSGVAVLEMQNVSEHLGKHESGHLLGYLYHDSLPLFVIGYPWEGFPWKRDTLMMLYGQSNDLSPRALDALRYFWRGMERRTGQRFLKR
ncbi:MAG: hypothetical protein ACYC7E_13395 [Armatimonadota bacterium]